MTQFTLIGDWEGVRRFFLGGKKSNQVKLREDTSTVGCQQLFRHCKKHRRKLWTVPKMTD